MSDWLDELTPDERQQWDEFVDHFRRDAVQKIAASAMVASLVPDPSGIDVKFCVELGAAIMLDKPIIGIVMPGAEVPGKLRQVADRIVEADVDTEEGRAVIAQAIQEETRIREALDEPTDELP